MKNKFLALLVISMVIFFESSCNQDDEATPPANDGENITKVVFTVTETGTTNSTDYTWNFIIGVMPNINLTTNKSYTTTIKIYNGSTDITQEIINEKDDHLIVYATTLTGVSMSRNSNDIVRTDGKKLGLSTTITTGNTTSTGEFTVKLVHLPTTVSDSNGFGTTTGGATDVDISFISSIL